MQRRKPPAQYTSCRRLLAPLLALSILGAASAQDATTTSSDSNSASQHLTDGWFGQRQRLEDKGIAFDLTYTVDGTKNLKGGLDTEGEAWRRLFEAAITVDTKKLLGLEGGTAYLDFQDAQGPNASDELVGDIQGIDGLDGVPGAPHQNRTQLAELWYQQTLFDSKVRVKVGKVDANTEFDRCDAAQPFLHQSTGSSATMFTMPTYPDPAISVNLFLKPRDDLQIGFGVYDGSLGSGVRTGELGPQPLYHGGAGRLFLIGEIDKSWTIGANKLAGQIGVGGWYSTNDFARLDGGEANGTGGPYAFAQQTVWRANPSDENDARGVAVFVMYGYADPAIVQFGHNIGGGIAWTGPIEARPNDVLGLGVQAVRFSDGFNATARFEASYEMFYQLQLTPWLMIKPDLQYVANPGGQGTPDALALTLRVQLDF
jgi:porin